jgi:hypothetical protein
VMVGRGWTLLRQESIPRQECERGVGSAGVAGWAAAAEF